MNDANYRGVKIPSCLAERIESAAQRGEELTNALLLRWRGVGPVKVQMLIDAGLPVKITWPPDVRNVVDKEAIRARRLILAKNKLVRLKRHKQSVELWIKRCRDEITRLGKP